MAGRPAWPGAGELWKLTSEGMVKQDRSLHVYERGKMCRFLIRIDCQSLLFTIAVIMFYKAS